MSAVAIGFASCEDKSDLGIAQVNPQEPTIDVTGFALSGIPGSVNLDATVNQTIPVATVTTAPTNLAEGAEIQLAMQLSASEDYENATTLDVVDGAVSSDDWENFVLAQGSKSPAVVDNYIRFAAYILNNGQLSRIGGENTWFGATKVAVTPVDLRLDVESSYYLVTSAGKIEMTHSDEHIYDDPVFQYMIEVSSDQVPYYWQIAPGSAVNGSDADFYGVSETGAADELSGNLVLGSQKGELNVAGKYRFYVNMLDKTYYIEKNSAPDTDYLWTPGPASGWGFENNMLLSNQDNGSFTGYVYVDGEFKLCAQADWDPLNWGLNGGVLTPGGDNIKVDPSGLYYVTADFNDMTIGLVEITSVSLIGAFNNWGGDAALTPNENYTIWSGDVDFTEAGEWKFRMNNNWDINLGGSEANLTQGGDNLSVPEAGVYTVTLDLSKLPYSCTVVKK